MQPPHQHSRINLAELKAQIIRKLGPERSKQYFSYLNRLLSSKLCKFEFNKLCLRIVGRENIPLHNQFIRSILKNACSAKIPPPTQDVEFLKQKGAVENKDPPTDGSLQNGSHPAITLPPNPSALTNGDILPPSPRKARTGIRDRRVGDRRTAFGPNGKTKFPSQISSTTNSGDFNVSLENGELTPPDIRRPVHHHQGHTQQAENKEEGLVHHPAKLPVTERSSDGPFSVHSNDQYDLLVRKDGKEVSARNLLHAPLGIPFCQASVGGARRPLPLAGSSNAVSTFSCGGLLDSITLRERMDQIAGAQGLEGVSMECANVLNSGLDAYLKGLIRSSVELVGARSGYDTTKIGAQKHQAHSKLVNGLRRGHHFQVQSSSRSLEVMQEHGTHCPISLLDFRVAMELNPQQLGEDWPFLLEKICTHSFEE